MQSRSSFLCIQDVDNNKNTLQWNTHTRTHTDTQNYLCSSYCIQQCIFLTKIHLSFKPLTLGQINVLQVSSNFQINSSTLCFESPSMLLCTLQQTEYQLN